MLGGRTAIGVGCCALLLGLCVACGGTTERGHGQPPDEPPVGSGGRPVDKPPPVGVGGSSSAGAGGKPSSGGTPGIAGGLNVGGRPIEDPPPVDTGCPIEELPEPTIECDAFGPNTCAPGLGCYPFVDHPQGDGCDAQVYGTLCLPAGMGTQGMLCGDETGDWCAPGFVCVVGQRAGKRCAALCDVTAADNCQGGLVCGDLDVAGFGVCG